MYTIKGKVTVDNCFIKLYPLFIQLSVAGLVHMLMHVTKLVSSSGFLVSQVTIDWSQAVPVIGRLNSL